MRYITYSCRFAKNRLPKYAPSRCEGKAARMPPTAYGGALRKAQEAPERRGRFKSDHLQKRGRLIRYSIAYQMQLRIYKEPTTGVRAEKVRGKGGRDAAGSVRRRPEEGAGSA